MRPDHGAMRDAGTQRYAASMGTELTRIAADELDVRTGERRDRQSPTRLAGR